MQVTRRGLFKILISGYLGEIIERLESSPSDASVCMFTLTDGTLYRRNVYLDGPDLLLVLPSQLRSTVLRELHDAPTVRHLAVTRTQDHMRRRFYWPGLALSVRSYVSACELCQRRKKASTLPAGYLQPIDVSPEPYFCVGLDFLRPIPTPALANK